MPPGGASAWMRAAMLMLSPKSPASVRTTSPRWMPMRMRRAFGRPCESAASRVWIATAASTASTALWKSATKQSPTNTSSVPLRWGTTSRKTSRTRPRPAIASASLSPMSRLYPVMSASRTALSRRARLSSSGGGTSVPGGAQSTPGATARRRPLLARLRPRMVGERGLPAMADWRALTDTVLVHRGSVVTLGLLALAGLVHRLAPAEESRRGGVAVWMLAAALALRLAGTVAGASAAQLLDLGADAALAVGVVDLVWTLAFDLALARTRLRVPSILRDLAQGAAVFFVLLAVLRRAGVD